MAKVKFENRALALKNCEAPLSSYAPNTGSFLELASEKLESGWKQLFSDNLKALKEAAAAMNS